MAHKVRIGQTGVSMERGIVDTLDDVEVGVNLAWIEIDGHRFDGVISAEFNAEAGVTVPSVTLLVCGPVEIVYLDKNAEPLGVIESAPEHLAGSPIGYGSMVERPAP